MVVDAGLTAEIACTVLVVSLDPFVYTIYEESKRHVVYE
jgi:hypothetical protein